MSELAAYQEEIQRRAVRVSPVTVVTVAPGTSSVVPPGTATVFWGRAGSENLTALRRALEAGADDTVRALLEADPEFDLDAEVSQEEGYAGVPALGALRYAGKALMEALPYLPASSAIGRYEVGYSGGTVDPSRFSAVSYCLPDAEPLAFVVALAAPAVGEREARLLAAVPEELSEVHLSVVQPMTTPAVTQAARFAGKAVAAHLVNKAADYTADRVQHWAHNIERGQAQARQRQAAREHAAMRAYPGWGLAPGAGEVDPEDIDALENLDPTAAVQELLRRRTALLGGEET